jgi:hypothetical protein
MARELLGEVTCPSGTLLVVDIGLLGMWKHAQPPLLEEWEASPETLAIANRAVDYRVEGRDATAANALFGQARGWLYDRSPDFVGTFDTEVRERGLEARLVAAAERIPHVERVQAAVAGPSRSGVVEFHGIGAPCVGALPTDRVMKVFGTRVGTGDFAAHWQHVELDVRHGAMTRTERVGEVLVDCARLGFVDVEALSRWEHDEPIDGKADFLFWGADAAEVARDYRVPHLGEEQYGWLDLPVEEIVALGRQIEELRETTSQRFATDFRPHSHHHQVMARIRANSTESGTLELGRARLCAFMTGWGDGVFPVEIDRDATGTVLAVRIVLGTDEARGNMRQAN